MGGRGRSRPGGVFTCSLLMIVLCLRFAMGAFVYFGVCLHDVQVLMMIRLILIDIPVVMCLSALRS